jgi:hypothetical protein
MWIGRLRRALDELNSQRDRAVSDEETAGFELARSARTFSQRARAITDDKLAFSATLMRAGEVGAASRLIDDLEQDVREQQAALVEQAEAVRKAAARRRTKVTRLRMARTLAVALMSAGLLTFSVAGIGLASFLSEMWRGGGETTSSEPGSRAASADHETSGASALRNVRLPDGTRVSLTPAQFRTFKSLSETRGLAPAELEQLLLELVGPRLASRLADAIAGVTAQGIEDLNSAAEDMRARVDDAGNKAGGGEGDASSGGEKPVDQGHEAPEKPHDGGIIDAPLDGTNPPQPDSVLPGGN